ncbi:MAG: TetR/AcrR family transcriptional regulator [Prevotella sp.]|nr:TetR/AcrR family transcriptional regulator [Prevotella sp.]
MLRTFNISTYRQELRQKILQTAMRQFKERGVRNVKMDDISAIIGISKRTLYEIYENKEELLLEGLKFVQEQKTRELREFLSAKERNEIEVMVKFVKMQMEDLNETNPLFYVEIRRYKSVVNFMVDYHERKRQNKMEFLRKGVEHGYFVDGLNYDIVHDMGNAIINHVMETKLYERFPIQEIFHNYVSVLMRGYCTDKGIAELKKLF